MVERAVKEKVVTTVHVLLAMREVAVRMVCMSPILIHYVLSFET